MYTKPISQLTTADTAHAGGKGASLGELTHAGIPVPPGFVVLASAFEHFIRAADLIQEIKAELARVDTKAMHTVEDASARIRALILAAKLPNDIADEIHHQFNTLNTAFVAVRSSATAEDSKSAAWAGQLDTFLNTTASGLLENIQKCWASLFTPRAIFYRFEQGLGEEDISVAVVVQQMINSEKSGIAFSVHPMTEDHNQLIIEAGFGLGEAIVSGQVTPDSYVVSKEPRQIVDINIAEQTRGLFRTSTSSVRGTSTGPLRDISTDSVRGGISTGSFKGGNEWVELGERGGQQVLGEKEITELTELIVKIETHYGFPCDIEWAWEKGKFYITQSRPITTLKKQPATAGPLYEPGIGIFRWGPIPGYLFYIGDFIDSIFAEPREYFSIGHFPETHVLFDQHNLVWLNRDHEFREFCKKLFNELLTNPGHIGELRAAWKQAIANLENIEARGESRTFSNANDLRTFCAEFSAAILAFWEPTIVGEFANYGSESALRAGLKKYIPTEREIGKAMQVLTAPTEPSFFQVAEIELSQTTDLQAYAKKYHWLGNSYAGVKTLNEAYFQKEKQAVSPELANKLRQQFAQKKQDKIDWQKKYQLPEAVMNMAQIIVDLILDQDTRKAHMLKLQYYKEEVLKKSSIVLDVPIEKLRHVRLGELAAHAGKEELVQLVHEREQEFGVRLNQAGVTFLDADKAGHYWRHYSSEKIEGELNTLTGIVASRGGNVRTTGTIAVVLDPNAAPELPEGTFLVTTMTSPEFIHLMRQSAGIITDTGGLTSHAAILSRELNIPCIVNTKLATKLLRDGDRVEMDTHQGIVRVLGDGVGADDSTGGKNTSLPRPSDYIRMFAQKSFPYLFSNIFLGYYNSLGVISITGQNVWMSFFPKSLVSITNQEGKNLYTSKTAYRKYKQAFDNYIKESTAYFQTSLEKKKLSGADIKQFFEYVSNLFVYYSKTEFFYTDGVKPEQMAITVKEFDDLKLGGRAYLNSLFFEQKGYGKSFIRKIAGQSGVDEKELLNYNVAELANLVENGIQPTPVQIKNRLTFFESKDLTLFGPDAKSLTDEFFSNYLHLSAVIKGTVANKGKARGKARVLIPDSKDFEKIARAVEEMKAGEILVAETTSPDIIAACKKAAAIVTNQGGQLSHAAIVSRELGIPCVIGTDSDVTLNIKTGYEVEVDADNGVVKILKKNNEDEILQKIQSTDWEKNWAGDFSLLATSIAMNAYNEPMKATFGTSVDRVLILHKNGITDCYVSTPDFKKFAADLLLQVHEHPDVLTDWSTKLKQKTDEVYAILNRPIETCLTADAFLTLKQAFDAFGAYQISIKEIINHLSPELLDRYKSDLKDARIYCEKVYPDLEAFLDKLVHLIREKEQNEPLCADSVLSAELTHYLETKNLPDQRELANRYNCSGLLRWDSSIQKLDAQTVHEIESVWLKHLQDIRMIEGQTAFPGMVAGRCRIIHDFAKTHTNFQKGDILVTGMTDPNYVPLMKQAAAIITDAGGLLCHAAIVSRELGKPCIIATKIATKVLKDGDLVEVDADKGIVRILKQSGRAKTNNT